ncbi:MAG: ACP S-malonyltransferase, partial [Clostridia bacterium]|nr:ACP S-malonyltransferase [Clostridia bacterium]
GEYGALYAAGAFDFVTGLKLLAKRAELMDDACSRTCGGMASILNGDIDEIVDALITADTAEKLRSSQE